jgi:eukaryotic translation initiation factor 2C
MWVNKVLNMLVSSVLNESCFSSTDNMFFLTGGHTPLGPSLCAIRGYSYSVRPGMGEVLLNCKLHTHFPLEPYLPSTPVNKCMSAFFQSILVSQFLRDEATFPNRSERVSLLRGLRVQVMYTPKGKSGEDTAETKSVQFRTIICTGQPVRDQKFTPRVDDGKQAVAITVESHFLTSKPFVYNLVFHTY